MLLELRAALLEILSRKSNHHPKDNEAWGLLIAVIHRYRNAGKRTHAERMTSGKVHPVEAQSRADAATSGK